MADRAKTAARRAVAGEGVVKDDGGGCDQVCAPPLHPPPRGGGGGAPRVRLLVYTYVQIGI